MRLVLAFVFIALAATLFAHQFGYPFDVQSSWLEGSLLPKLLIAVGLIWSQIGMWLLVRWWRRP